MKKVLLGGMMFLAGVLSTALLLSGSMANDNMINGGWSAFWNLEKYGLMNAYYVFIVIAIVGFIIALLGVFERDKRTRE